MKTADLIARWTTAKNLKIMDKVRKSLIENAFDNVKDLVGLTPAGLTDLRFCPIKIGPDHRIVNLRLQGADLSGAEIGCLVMENCVFKDCLFDKATFSIFNERSCRFQNISFRGADFNSTGIGLHCSTYEHVDFSNSDLRGASFYSPQFIDCLFINTKLTHVDFSASNFINCVFGGKLKSVWFNRYYRFPKDEERFGKAPVNEMKNIDFTSASLWDVMFTGGLDLSTIKLPSDGKHFLVSNLHSALLDISVDKIPPTEREVITRWIKIFTRSNHTQSMKIFNSAEIFENMGEEAGEIFIHEIIRQNRSG